MINRSKKQIKTCWSALANFFIRIRSSDIPENKAEASAQTSARQIETASKSGEMAVTRAKNVKSHIFQSTTLICNPQTDVVYHIKTPHLEDEVTFTLTGSFFKECVYYDVISHSFLFKNGLSDLLFLPDDTNHFQFLTSEIFPTVEPKLFLCKNKNEVRPIQELKYDINLVSFNSNSYSGNFSWGSDLKTDSTTLSSSNESIKTECQDLLKDIPVHSGDLPFLIDNKPHYRFLENLYNQFVKYNNDKKLSEQYENSHGKCHIRAHFVSQFLNTLGISSVKLYKHWNKSDWSKFVDNNRSWVFHCAVMVVDDQNNKWVWDPWIGFNKNLVTLKQWMYRANEPKPTKLLIANNMVISDIEKGRKAEGIKFMATSDGTYIKSIQALFTKALPNRPQSAISNLAYEIQLFKCRQFYLKKRKALNSDQFAVSSTGKVSYGFS